MTEEQKLFNLLEGVDFETEINEKRLKHYYQEKKCVFCLASCPVSDKMNYTEETLCLFAGKVGEGSIFIYLFI